MFLKGSAPIMESLTVTLAIASIMVLGYYIVGTLLQRD
ncbi:hypothetical protein HNR53_000040 [Bacillus benzoevorans]|uniref:Uncharacterized protein n=1 Tax=Bacillus benzoevorans TaxID=1456 RepID=A0A7X0HMC5_9BACI|nr:hypothetical protein [Bacillus benzoevorans]